MNLTMALDKAEIPTLWDQWLGTVRQQRVAMVLLGLLIGVLAAKNEFVMAIFALGVMGVVGYGMPYIVRTHDVLERWTWQLLALVIIFGFALVVISARIMAAYLHEPLGLWAWLFGIFFALGAFAEWESSIPLEDFREYA